MTYIACKEMFGYNYLTWLYFINHYNTGLDNGFV